MVVCGPDVNAPERGNTAADKRTPCLWHTVLVVLQLFPDIMLVPQRSQSPAFIPLLSSIVIIVRLDVASRPITLRLTPTSESYRYARTRSVDTSGFLRSRGREV